MNSMLCALLYIFLLSLSTVYVQKLSLSVNVNILNFAVAIVCFAAFNLCNLSRCKYAYAVIKKDPLLWLVVSVSVAVSWLFSYFSTAFSSADFSMAILYLAMGTCASLHKKQKTKVVMCLLSIVLCYVFASKAKWDALVYGLISGTFLYVYAFYAKRFSNRNNLKPLDVLSTRFFPLIALSTMLMFWLTPGKSLSFAVSGYTWVYILILALTNRVIPIFFSQWAVQGMDTSKLSFLLSLVPLVTYIMQGLVDSYFPVDLFFAVLISTFSLNIDRFPVLSPREKVG